MNILFSLPSFNGSSGCCILKKNLFVNYRCINLPTATIRTVNLLEKACEIREYISKEINLPKQEIKLTALDIFEEKNQTPLFWHTDNRNGTYRAFVYLKGGEIDSGAFTYMLGTHRRKYYVEHKLDKLKIKENKNRIFTANSGLGSLVIANINGFHSNTPRKKTRRLIMLEYQLDKKKYSKSSILIPSYWISEKVKSNLDIFDNGALHEFNHSQDRRLKVLDPSIDSFFYITTRLIKPLVSKQIKFLNYILLKLLKIFK